MSEARVDIEALDNFIDRAQLTWESVFSRMSMDKSEIVGDRAKIRFAWTSAYAWAMLGVVDLAIHSLEHAASLMQKYSLDSCEQEAIDLLKRYKS